MLAGTASGRHAGSKSKRSRSVYMPWQVRCRPNHGQPVAKQLVYTRPGRSARAPLARPAQRARGQPARPGAAAPRAASAGRRCRCTQGTMWHLLNRPPAEPRTAARHLLYLLHRPASPLAPVPGPGTPRPCLLHLLPASSSKRLLRYASPGGTRCCSLPNRRSRQPSHQAPGPPLRGALRRPASLPMPSLVRHQSRGSKKTPGLP
jgi:hypothetical protein